MHILYYIIILFYICNFVICEEHTVTGSLSAVNRAITAAHDGDVIVLAPGVWSVCDETLIVDKRITIRGAGAVIDCGASLSTVLSSSVAATEVVVVIDSLTIINVQNAIVHTTKSVHMILRNMTLDSVSVGVFVEHSSVDITGMSITNSVDTAIRLSDAIALINNTYISRCNSGIVIATGSIVDMYSTIIQHHYVVTDAGVFLHVYDRSVAHIYNTTVSDGNGTAGACVVSQNATMTLNTSMITRCSCVSAAYGVGCAMSIINSSLAMIYSNVTHTTGVFAVTVQDAVHVEMMYSMISDCSGDCVRVTGSYKGMTGEAILYYGTISRCGGVCLSVDFSRTIVSLYNMTITDGMRGFTVSTRANVTMTSCHVSRCTSTSGGGCGVVKSLSTLTVIDSVFSHCHALNGGGVGLFDNSRLTLINSTISHCTAVADGGGVYVDKTCIFNAMNGSVIEMCSVNGSGGALSINGNANLFDFRCESNVAGVRGGCGVMSVTVTVTNSAIINCSALAGGGLFVNKSMLNVSSSSFTSCHATGIHHNDDDGSGAGGAMATWFGTVHFKYVVVSDCHASTGGFIHSYGGNVNVTNTTVTLCSASVGGAVYVDGEYYSSMMLMDCFISHCWATLHAGAIYAVHWGSVVTMISSQCNNCSAVQYGGCVAVNTTGTLYSINSVMTNCRSSYGSILYTRLANVSLIDTVMRDTDSVIAGILVHYKSYLYMSNSSITNSTAIDSAGCLSITDNSRADIEHSTVSDCGAIFGGAGCVNVDKNSALYLMSSTIKNCYCAEYGGCIKITSNQAPVSIVNSSITNCTAIDQGGGMGIIGASTVILTSSSITNCRITSKYEQKGGGIFALLTTLTVSHTVVHTIDGHGMYLSDAIADISDTTLYDCHTVGGNGGGIYAAAINLTLHSVVITNCTADVDGGGVYVEKADLRMYNCEISDSHAGHAGGCLRVDQSVVTQIINSTLSRCTAPSHGCLSTAGISGVVLIEGASFNGCHSTGYGGAIGIETSRASTINIRQSTFFDNSALGGGSVYLGANDEAVVFISNCSFYNSTADSGACVAIKDYASSPVVLDNVLISGSVARVVGGGIHVVNSFNVTVSNSVITDSKSYMGAGIAIDVTSVMHMTNTLVIRNLGDGVSNNGTLYTDNDTRLCRNFPRQIIGDYIGDPIVCGHISSVIGSDDTVVPGSHLTVSGDGMLLNSTDVIEFVQENSVVFENVPFSFVVSERKNVKRCPLSVRSRYGVVSESFNDYTWMPVDVSKCSVTLVDSDDDVVPVMYGVSVMLRFTLIIGCNYEPHVTCHFGGDSVRAVLEFHDSNNTLMYICEVPAYTENDDHDVLYKRITYNVTFPANVSHVVHDNRQLVIYPRPSPRTVTPAVAHYALTIITLCDVDYYPWAVPQCHFTDDNGVNAVVATYTSDHKCLNCMFASSVDCDTRQNDTAGLSLYYDQIVTSTFQIIHICKPAVARDVRLYPPYVVISEHMSLYVPAAELYVSDYMRCRCDDVIGHAYYGGGGQLECTISQVPPVSKVMISITNDNQTWVNVTMVEFTLDLWMCDAGSERLTEGVECTACDVGYYKREKNNKRCLACETNRLNNMTGATDCYCRYGYQSQKDSRLCVECLPRDACPANTSSACSVGYTGDRCSDCSDGYYRSQTLCMECSRSNPYVRLSLFIIALLISVSYLFSRSFDSSSSSLTLAAISIGYSFLQVFALVGSVPQGDQVADPFGSTFQYLSGVNLNVQSVAHQCLMDGDSQYFFVMYCIKLLLLPAVLAWIWVLVGSCMVVRMNNKARDNGDIMNAGVSSSVLLVTLMYLVMTSSVLSYVSCTHLENGPWVLDASPDIECFGTEHLNNLWMFVIGMIVYVIGIPAYLYHIIVVQRQRTVDNGMFSKRFGFLSYKYHDYVYFWELVVLARKALLVISFLIWSRAITIKLMFTIVVLIGALYFQNWYKPMNDPTLDLMESITLVMNAIVLTFTLTLALSASDQPDSMSDSSRRFITVLFVSIVLCCVSVIVWIIVFIVRQQIKSDKNDDKQMTLLETDDYEKMR